MEGSIENAVSSDYVKCTHMHAVRKVVQQYVLPRQRPKATNLRLVKHKDISAWAAAIAWANTQPGNTPAGFDTCARSAYTETAGTWSRISILVFKPQLALG